MTKSRISLAVAALFVCIATPGYANPSLENHHPDQDHSLDQIKDKKAQVAQKLTDTKHEVVEQAAE